jgi:hypothetical protein
VHALVVEDFFFSRRGLVELRKQLPNGTHVPGIEYSGQLFLQMEFFLISLGSVKGMNFHFN